MIDVEAELSKRDIEYKLTGEDRKGNSYAMICCPFHDDTNPSMSVSITSGRFRCFSGRCGEQGPFRKLLAELDGVAMEDVRLSDSVKISELQSRVLKSLDATKEGPEFLNAREFKKVFLPIAGSPGELYMANRGIPSETQKRFRLRWGHTGKYENRVIIPTLDHDGRLVSYTGRKVEENSQRKKVRRKGGTSSVLFGLYQLLRIKKPPFPVVLVEGEIDAMYLQSKGVPAVCVFGTREITNEQLALLRRFSKRVTVAFDGDEAGRLAMFGGFTPTGERKVGAVERIRPYMRTVSVELPQGSDPNSLNTVQVDRFFEREKHGWQEAQAQRG